MSGTGDTPFACSECGCSSRKWLGQCPGCGAWNSFAPVATAGAPRRRRAGTRGAAPVPVPVAAAGIEAVTRTPTGLEGVDRVLGGGLVTGSVILLAGDPGVGKSTLLLQVAASIAGAGRPVLYVSGEESTRQVGMRAARLGAASADLLLLAETSVEAVLQATAAVEPGLLVVDSIQTMASEDLEAVAGSVSQVRHSAGRLQGAAKERGVPVVLVGHVTKDGTIAGPRLLEHLVDVVLSFHGEAGHDLRALRASKNRFGTVAELALFSMGERGLEPVRNPSAWLLADRRTGMPGSVVTAAVEGTTPLLVEVQALVSGPVLGTPRRVAQGVGASRLALLLAVLERHAGVALGDRDVYVNLVGGLELDEPALDLAVAAAVLSSTLDRPLPADLVVCGEVGLLGEVRAVSRAADRVREAAALGFGRVVLPSRDAGSAVGLPTIAVGAIGELRGLLGDRAR